MVTADERNVLELANREALARMFDGVAFNLSTMVTAVSVAVAQRGCPSSLDMRATKACQGIIQEALELDRIAQELRSCDKSGR